MKSWLKAILFGFLIWLIPFIVAFAIFFIHDSNRPLFESIMAVTVTGSAMVIGLTYMKNIHSDFLREGTLLGVIWFVVSILIDAPLMLLGGPMLITFEEYMSDIGTTYLIIPIVTIGIALAKTKNHTN